MTSQHAREREHRPPKDRESISKLWRLPLRALAFNLHEASELAAVLEEATTGDIRIDVGNLHSRSINSRSHTPTPVGRSKSLAERIKLAQPLNIAEGAVEWSRLSAVVSTEALSESPHSMHSKRQIAMDVNSGGRVFFCLLRPELGVLAGSEGVLVVKFAPSRLLMQAEQFANELTRHLDICAPECRIVRQAGTTSSEWASIVAAVQRIGPPGEEFASELDALPCLLLMEFVRGRPLLRCIDAFSIGPVKLFEDLGRMFLLDMVLGNADRLPSIDLGWRGNPNNIMHGAQGSKMAGRAVAIDSCVQRRPPAARLSREDTAVDRLAQLLLNDPSFALQMLRGGLMAGSRSAVAALAQRPGTYVSAFQRGLRLCLDKVVGSKGLLEMIHQKMSEWVLEFIADVREHAPHLDLHTPLDAAGFARGVGGYPPASAAPGDGNAAGVGDGNRVDGASRLPT
ncbi:hypothetical protein FOA52_004257 [Chlamydomonas sp. UWO 241]|nr:hypothetical protein FOA52_004257 [Chlamydomonas sp. UWO 241]